MLEMPQGIVRESIENAANAISNNLGQAPAPTTATSTVKARRIALHAMELDALKGIHAAATLTQARQEEAKRFYNKPEAMANYDYWLAMDFWTLEEAVALIARRNPRVVNRASVANDLAPKKGLFSGPTNPPTAFTKFFDSLLHYAERSNAMTHSPRLTPTEAIQWARSVLGQKVPEPLLAYLEKQPLPAPVTSSEAASPAPDNRTLEERKKTKVKRAALLKLEQVWPTVANDLQHSNRNGLADAAKTQDFGLWWEEDALQWARANGRLNEPLPQSALHDLPRRIHQLK